VDQGTRAVVGMVESISANVADRTRPPPCRWPTLRAAASSCLARARASDGFATLATRRERKESSRSRQWLHVRLGVGSVPGPTAGKTPPRYQSLYIVLKPVVGCRVGVWGVESVLEMKLCVVIRAMFALVMPY